MEAVARQFATNQNCLVLRNGWFSFRWSQIFEMGSIPSEETVMKAYRVCEGTQAPFVPADFIKEPPSPNCFSTLHTVVPSGIF